MEINIIAKKINKMGGKLYYVGGYVRDELMKVNPKDIDLCVVGLTPENFKNMFPKAFLKGDFFPVFQLNNHDFAFARRETKIGIGHKNFTFETENVTIYDDLARRDFTINSIAKDVLTGEIIDPFNGQKDIENKIIRATSNHFNEDPLRVYRGAQFATRFNFRINEETKKMMKLMKSELYSLSSERVFTELRKALKSDTPSTFFNILRELDLLKVHFKEIEDLIDVPQPIKYHPEGDVYNHSMIALDMAAKLTTDEKIRFAALTHDLGKAKTPKEILPHHYDHEKNGIAPLKEFCKKLNIPNAWKKLAQVSVKEHMRAGLYNNMSIPKKVEFLERNEKFLCELEIIAISDKGPRSNEKISFFEIGKKMFNEVNGKTVNLPNNENAKGILHQKRIEWLKKENHF